MDKGKIIFDILNDYVYNDENKAGVKLQVIDANDLPKIIPEIVKKLTIPVVSKCDHKDEHGNDLLKYVAEIGLNYCSKCNFNC